MDTMLRRAPSGAQVEICHGSQRAVVVEVGGALRRYVAASWDVLDGYAAGEMCSGARGQTLIPWPNRLRDGRFPFGGEHHQLPLSEPERRNAIHGLVRWRSWTMTERDVDRVRMEHLLHPQPGYPWTLALAITYRLDDGGLTVTTSARNVGDRECPYATGAHPYLTVQTATVDACLLRAPGRMWLPTDERGIPAGRADVQGTSYDFLERRTVGGVQLDTAFGDLHRDADGRAVVELTNPDRSRAVALWMDDKYRYVMLFTGDSLPNPDSRRRGLGVEPMTCPPNGLQTGEDAVVLQPGDEFTASWGIVPRVARSSSA